MTFPSDAGDNFAFIIFLVVVLLVGYASYKLGKSKITPNRQVVLFQILPIAAWYISSALALDVFKLQEGRIFLWFGQLLLFPLATTVGSKIAQRKHTLTVPVSVAANISAACVFVLLMNIFVGLGWLLAIYQRTVLEPHLTTWLIGTGIVLILALAGLIYAFRRDKGLYGSISTWLVTAAFLWGLILLELRP